MTVKPATRQPHILVVDDEPDLRTLYELTLLREGYQVAVAQNLQEARQLLQDQRFDVLITDMRLPDGLGIELLHLLGAEQRAERGVVITAYGSAENAVESLKAGAFDYLTKPVDLKQFRRVIAAAANDVGRGLNGHPVGKRNAVPERNANLKASDGAALDRLIGISAPMREVKDRIAKVANSMAPVLVRGESGTGKELVARALHGNSHRHSGPFVAVNCSAIPETLLEAEFFGVRKGAYTGASQNRDGFFQAARGGSLFLDEIGDLPLAMQSKLLRAIQERCVRPVGESQEETVDVRIISATHKDLPSEVQAGHFRQDLFYRLNVIDINLPPLRERQEDLGPLCTALLQRIAAETGITPPTVSADQLTELARLPLLGNVRELENLLHRAVALSNGSSLQLQPLPSAALPLSVAAPVKAAPQPQPVAPATAQALPNDLQGHLDQQEREILVLTLQQTGYNRTAAAARLGLTLRQIRYRIARLNIDVPQGSDGP